MKPARALVVALLPALAGCGGSVPPTRYYVLQPQDLRPAEAFVPATARGLAIGVATLRVDPPYDQDRIVYRVRDGSSEIGFYAYHRWAAPLERMLPGVIASAYRGLPGAGSIEPAVAGRQYDATLHGRILALEEIDTPASTRVRVRLSLRLEGRDGSALWSETLSQDADVPSDEVAGVVERMRSALAQALERSRPGLQAALQRAAR